MVISDLAAAEAKLEAIRAELPWASLIEIFYGSPTMSPMKRKKDGTVDKRTDRPPRVFGPPGGSRRFSVDAMTAVQAKEHLQGRAGAVPFDRTVMVASLDCVFWCRNAYHEQVGPWHFIWTEHNGDHFYHVDEVVKLNVAKVESQYEVIV